MSWLGDIGRGITSTLSEFPIIGGVLGSVANDFLGFTQADAQKEINQLQQQLADEQANRQRRNLIRQAQAQEQQVRAAQAVQGGSSAANLAQANVVNTAQQELGFIDFSQQIGRDISAENQVIADANETRGLVNLGINVATGNPAGVASFLSGTSQTGGTGIQPGVTPVSPTINTGTAISAQGAMSSPAPGGSGTQRTTFNPVPTTQDSNTSIINF